MKKYECIKVEKCRETIRDTFNKGDVELKHVYAFFKNEFEPDNEYIIDLYPILRKTNLKNCDDDKVIEHLSKNLLHKRFCVINKRTILDLETYIKSII